MNRLTKRTICGTANLAYPESCYFKSGAKDQIAVSAYRQQAIERLAEYEDMEEQGLLVRLPCKARDMVWIKGDKFPAEIEEIRITDDGIYFSYVEYDRGYEETEVWDNDEFTLSDFGKTVFLTRKEAEKALEARKDG